jgi:hypothetical protein
MRATNLYPECFRRVALAQRLLVEAAQIEPSRWGDFNGDGKLDVVTENQMGSKLASGWQDAEAGEASRGETSGLVAYESVEPSGSYRREDEEAIAWLSAGMGRASFARRLRVEI